MSTQRLYFPTCDETQDIADAKQEALAQNIFAALSGVRLCVLTAHAFPHVLIRVKIFYGSSTEV